MSFTPCFGLLYEYFTPYAKVQVGYRGDFTASLIAAFAATVFGLASFYPSVRLLGRAAIPEYAPLVPVVAIVFLGLAISLWNLGTRHYPSTGS